MAMDKNNQSLKLINYETKDNNSMQKVGYSFVLLLNFIDLNCFSAL